MNNEKLKEKYANELQISSESITDRDVLIIENARLRKEQEILMCKNKRLLKQISTIKQMHQLINSLSANVS